MIVITISKIINSMNLQFISDIKGKTTGVFIPINEWNVLKKKYKGIEQEELYIPSWQMDIAIARLEEYDKNPDQAMDFDTAMDEIEAGL